MSAAKLSDADLERVRGLLCARDEAIAAANIAQAEAQLAHAKWEAMHADIVRRYKLRPGDAYEDDGSIVRAKQEAPKS